MKVNNTEIKDKYNHFGGLNSPKSNALHTLGESSFNDWSNNEIG